MTPAISVPPPPRARVLGVAKTALGVLGVGLVFVGSTAASAVAHLDHPAARRLVVKTVNDILSTSFKGKLVIEKVDRIRVTKGVVEGVDAHLDDAEGHRIVTAKGVSVVLSPVPLVKSLLSGGPLVVPIRYARIDQAELLLRDDAKGSPSIAGAFDSPVPDKPLKPGEKDVGIDLRIDQVFVVHLWAHGAVGTLPVDADVAGLSTSLAVDDKAFTAKVAPVLVHARALPVPAREGTVLVDGDLSIPLLDSGKLAIRANAEANVGKLIAQARGTLVGDVLDAHVDVPRFDPKELAAVVEGVEIGAPISATVDASGTLTDLRAQGRVDVGEGHLDVAGGVKRGALTEADAAVKIVNVKLRDAAPQAPEGIVDGEVYAKATIDAAGALAVTYKIDTKPTTIAAQPVPAVGTTGTYDGRRLAGDLVAEEPGARTFVKYALEAEKDRPSVQGLDLDVRAEIPSLRAVRRLPAAISGAATVRAKAHLSLGDRIRVKGDVQATGRGLSASGATAAGVEVRARVDGDIAAPVVHAVVNARGVAASGVSVRAATVRVDGPVLSPRVGVDAVSADGDALAANLSLSLAGGVGVRGIDARFVRNEEEIHVVVAAVRVGGGVVQVDGVKITGAAGTLEASAFYGGSALRLKAVSAGLDLARLTALAGDRAPQLAGTLAFDVDVDRGPRRSTGHVAVTATQVSGFGLHGLDAKVKATLEDRAVAATVEASLEKVGKVQISTRDGRLGGDVLAKTAFVEATGAVDTKLEIDLAAALSLVPAFFRPLEAVEGILTATTSVSRKDGKARPDVKTLVSTRGLEVELLPSKEGVRGQRFTGMDGAVAGEYVGTENDLVLGAAVADPHGSLVEVGLRTKPPLDAALAGGPALREKLMATPFALSVRVPERKLRDLPEFVPTNGLLGSVGLRLGASGTVRKPDLAAVVTVKGLQSPQRSKQLGAQRGPQNRPLDLTIASTFADDKGQVDATVDVDGRTVMTAKTHGALAFSDILEQREGGPRWKASGGVHFFALPLRPLSSIARVPLSGCLTGIVTLEDLHEDAKVAVDLRVDGLRIRGVSFREARILGKAEGGVASIDAAILQEDGELRAKGEGGLKWGAALAPTPDFEKPATGALEAKAFRLAPLQPLLQDTFSKLDGRLTADLRYSQTGRDPRTGKLSGQVFLRDGVVDPVIVGQELHDVRADIRITEGGEIRLENASLRGSEGRAHLEGIAQVEGLALKSATAKLTIAKREAIPVTFEGVEYGEAFGEVRLTAKEKEGILTLDVALPRLTVELPDTPTKSTQKLEEEPTIRTGTRTETRFAALPLGNPKDRKREEKPQPVDDLVRADGTLERKPPPAPAKGGVLVRVDLGNELRIRKGSEIDLYLRGSIDASTLEDKVAVSGLIQVSRGYAEVQGRRFQIERASVSFNPDHAASDPTLSATALYIAPDSTRVYADFIGTASAGKLRLRSEPPLTQAEILSLVVFGQREGVGGGGRGPSGASRAAGLGGGVVTQGLNKALSNVTPLEITTRVDTTSGQNPRPEVGVAITKDVSAAVAYRIGLPTPGQAPDRSLLKLDYRFRPHWSIETTLGDKGTSIVDLTWKYRY